MVFLTCIYFSLKLFAQLPLLTMNSIYYLGYRLGKGGGYADLEYAMMRSLGFIDESTPVITTVHDCQIVDIPDELMEDHDFDVSQAKTLLKHLFDFIYSRCK